MTQKAQLKRRRSVAVERVEQGLGVGAVEQGLGVGAGAAAGVEVSASPVHCAVAWAPCRVACHSPA